MNIETYLEQFSRSAVDYPDLALSILILVVSTAALRMLFLHFLSDASRSEVETANVIPLISIAVFLVTYAVRHSIALSLGVVGALSITRFRAPVKNIEDLVFIFMSVCIGVGLSAGQKAITLIMLVLFITVFTLLRASKRRFAPPMLLTLTFPIGRREISKQLPEQLGFGASEYLVQNIEENSEELVLTLALPRIQKAEIHSLHQKIAATAPKSFLLSEVRI